MANLPRFGRTWQRFSALPRPGSASGFEVQPLTATAEPPVFPSAPTTTDILRTSPIKEKSPRFPSPVRKFPSPPSSPKYSGVATTTSPRKPPSPTLTYNRYDGERRTSATSSPKTINPTHISPPKHKHSVVATAASLSPQTLPRSEVRYESEHRIRSTSSPEAEQKKIFDEKTTEKPTKTNHRQAENISGKPHQKQHQQLQSDVINIEGENVGAVMHITQSSNGPEILKKKAGFGESKENEEEANKPTSNFPAKSFMNSNFQDVNNSIMCNSSLSHRDPGLHLAFSKNPNHGDSLHDSRN